MENKVFYLVRSPNCYHKAHYDKNSSIQGKMDTLEEAQQAALEVASQTRSTYYVYEVKLVGKAHLNEAIWTPET